jgi:L-alanine-DL-glutamate epimerase-like enolase superfamily enzyme
MQDGLVDVPTAPGIGVTPDRELIGRLTVREERLRRGR